MKWGIIRIHFQVTLDADERFKQNSPKMELPVIYFCGHNFFQKVEGNNLQISSGQKKCREILQYPFFSFSSTTFPQHGHSTILYFEMLTSLLGVRSSLFCCSSWPPFRTPLLPSRCSPRCNASTLESGSQGLRTPIYIWHLTWGWMLMVAVKHTTPLLVLRLNGLDPLENGSDPLVLVSSQSLLLSLSSTWLQHLLLLSHTCCHLQHHSQLKKKVGSLDKHHFCFFCICPILFYSHLWLDALHHGCDAADIRLQLLGDHLINWLQSFLIEIRERWKCECDFH